ncbi:unnamed protein product [Caenorhabditis angaria]|uniref:glucuronosyltransferase n=1 Tax=Caenorhabditis angaria TaxID=860376 RepID=A0A9P1IMG7_9PELO|nr:unnamed protein product [Caenorhabditis angaria]
MIFLIFLSISLPAIKSYNFLITNPILGYSHVKFKSNIADVLADAGHNVTLLQYYHNPMENLKNLVKNPRVEIIHYYPDNFAELLEKSRKIGTFPEFWATKSMDSPFLRYFTQLDIIPVLWNNTYSKLLRDTKFLKTLEDRNFDAVLAETFEIGGFYIAHLINARSVIAIMSSVKYPYTEQLFGQPATLGYIPGEFSKFGKEATVWDRLNDIYHEFFSVLFHKSISDRQHQLYRDILGKTIRNLPDWQDLVRKSTYFFVNSNPFLDFSVPKTPNIIAIGGFGFDATRTQKILPEEYQKIMGEHTVLICFGSVLQSSEMPDDFKMGFIQLFKAFPNITFIWKYEQQEDEFIRKNRLGPNVHLRSWIPQSILLRNERVKLFITHGGLASTMEVAYSGKPALVIPLINDQFHNGMMLSRHGGAITYNKYDLADPVKLIETVRRILETPRFVNNLATS